MPSASRYSQKSILPSPLESRSFRRRLPFVVLEQVHCAVVIGINLTHDTATALVVVDPVDATIEVPSISFSISPAR